MRSSAAVVLASLAILAATPASAHAPRFACAKSALPTDGVRCAGSPDGDEPIIRIGSKDSRDTADSASFEPKFRPPDGRTKALLVRLFKGLSASHQDLSPPFLLTDTPEAPTIAWVRTADDEPPFLFVLPGAEYCGASDCLILGYRQTPAGWTKVYEAFGGDSIRVLAAKTKGHRNIRQMEAGASEARTWRWTGDRYATAE